MEETEKASGPLEQTSTNGSAEETRSTEGRQPKEPDEVTDPTDVAEGKNGAQSEREPSPELLEVDSSAVEEDSEVAEDKPADDDSTNRSTEEAGDTLSGDNSTEEKDLLRQSVEERELQARDTSLCDESYDEDFLIMDEVHGDDDEDEKKSLKASKSTPTGSVESLTELTPVEVDNSRVEEKPDAEKNEDETKEKVEEDSETMSAQEGGEVPAAEEYGSDDDVIIEEPPVKQPIVITMSGEEASFSDPVKKDDKNAPDTGTEAPEAPCQEEGVDKDSVEAKSRDVEEAKKTLMEDTSVEASQSSSSELPVENGSADDSKEEKSDTKKDLPECNGTSSQVKRPLSPEGWIDADVEAAKKIKCEAANCVAETNRAVADVKDGMAAEVAAAMGDQKVVVMTRGELEKYVNLRVQESLAKQEQTMLQPMEKKCDTLHRALERWRRRSFQLQKQLNEFVCEQDKCAGARTDRVHQRSVGVCVRMPPLRSAAPTMPTIRTSPSAGSIVSSTPTSSASTPQASRSSINVSTTAARGSMAPTVRVLTVPPPATAAPTVLSRLSTQTTSASGTTNVPVPLQLIANTSSPTSQVKSVSLPCTTGSNTVVRTVTMMPSSTAVVTTSAGVKVIDLTQEEDANLARLVAGSTVSGGSILTNKTTFAVSTAAGAGGTVQKITVPSSAIPMLSAAPTSLVQVSSVSSKNTSTTHVIGSPNVPTSTGTIRIGQPVVAAPQRVTYLLPNLSPNVVVNQREGNPRLANSTMSMPTILLRMTSPANNLVPGSTISMSSLTPQPGSGGNLMVAPPGTQVRMIRAPTPVALQKGGNTFTLPPGTTVVRAPVTIPSAAGTTVVTKSDHGLPTQRVVVTGSLPAADSSLAKHPAPLPPMPRYLDDPKKKRLPPKPALKITKAASEPKQTPKKKAPARNMDQLVAQWQAYLNTGEEVGKTRVGRRPLDLPLRLACNCRLGTCRYATLSTAFKEKIYIDFRRYGSQMQSRTLLKRMYANGLKRKLKRAAQACRKARCKWHYYLPSETPGQFRRKVCKAAFMAVHGISEKRVREMQLLWLSEKNQKRPPWGPTESEEESSAPDEQVGEGEDSAEDAEKDEKGEGGGEEGDNEEETDAAQEPQEGNGNAEENNDDNGDDDDSDEVPFIDTSALEPICNLEEEEESLVLQLSPGAFDDADAAQS
ncbi:uncharacterized protein LOC135391875 isoform X2 [Ornithodoros turicata]|uniref:uncharacterized protein LOC135391875 isoform X2 n=1 Tax=Ornithodoros turicata TaxID=34597 RepID=UPI00313918EB